MCSVNLNTGKARIFGHAGYLRKTGDVVSYLSFREGPGAGVVAQ